MLPAKGSAHCGLADGMGLSGSLGFGRYGPYPPCGENKWNPNMVSVESYSLVGQSPRHRWDDLGPSQVALPLHQTSTYIHIERHIFADKA